MSEIPEAKAACFFPPSQECPASCPGLLNFSRFITYYVIEVCPNPELIGTESTFKDPDDDGPTVVTLHRDSAPDDSDCIRAINSW